MLSLALASLIAVAAAQRDLSSPSIPLPSYADYQSIAHMTTCCYQGSQNTIYNGILPWPHSYGTHHYKYYSWSDLRRKGQQFYSNVPSGQNATAMAAVVYDWLLPTYRRSNWYMTATSGGKVSNASALVGLFDEVYMPTSYRNPYIDEAFEIKAYDRHDRANKIINSWSNIQSFVPPEVRVLRYAAKQISEVSYSRYPMLYRGSRERKYFCNRFTQQYGLTVDQCVQAYMQPGKTICLNVFFSTTPKHRYISRYTGVATFSIHQNASRSSWYGAPIGELTGYADELLYVPGSCFTVKSVTCSSSTGQNLWAFDVEEIGLGVASPIVPFAQIDTSNFQQCVSTSVTARQLDLKDPLDEEHERFFH